MEKPTADNIVATFDAKFKAAKTPQDRAAVIAEFERAHAAESGAPVGAVPAEPQSVAHYEARFQAAKTPRERAQVVADLEAAHKAGKLTEDAP